MIKPLVILSVCYSRLAFRGKLFPAEAGFAARRPCCSISKLSGPLDIRTCPGRKWTPKSGQIVIRNFKNGAQHIFQSSPKSCRIEGRRVTFFARGGSGLLKTRIRTSTQAKRGEDTTAYPLFGRKSGRHGAKLASKIKQKRIINRCKNRSKDDAFQDRILKRSWWIFEAKMEACCTKIASKTCNLRICGQLFHGFMIQGSVGLGVPGPIFVQGGLKWIPREILVLRI